MSEFLNNPEHSTDYQLEGHTIRELIDVKLAQQPIDTSRSIVCYELLPEDPLSNVARTIECRVFKTTFQNDAEEMHRQYDPYNTQSRFFLSIDTKTREPVGVLRAIEPKEKRLKVFDDFSDVTQDVLRDHHDVREDAKCWEIATFAILPKYRKRPQIGTQYFRALYLSARTHNAEYILAAIDQKVYTKQVVGYLGLPYVQIHGTKAREYLGSSATIPIIGRVADFFPRTLRQMGTLKGAMAFRALYPLVFGTHDDAIYLIDGHPILK